MVPGMSVNSNKIKDMVRAHTPGQTERSIPVNTGKAGNMVRVLILEAMAKNM
jgi:hypothetical protein